MTLGTAEIVLFVVVGIVVSLLFFETGPRRSPRRRIVWMIVFALLLCLGGFLLRPLHGISKIHATPAWSLYCSGIGVLVYALLYWVVDVRRIDGWTRFLRPAGSNPLLTYILPSMVYFLLAWLQVTALSDYLGEGLTGVARSGVFTVLMLALACLLTRWNVKLRL